MSIVAGDLKLYKAATPPTTLATSTVGGAINTSAEITGGSVGEWFPSVASYGTGLGSWSMYAKVFFKNTHASIPLTGSVIYIENSLDDVGSSGTASVASSSASDNSTYRTTLLGLDASSNPQSEDFTMNGTSSVGGSLTWNSGAGGIAAGEFRNDSTGVLSATNGAVTVTRSSALGSIPAGYKTAVGEVNIWLEASLDGSTTTTNATTAPGGSSFSKPRTSGAGLTVANSQSLTAGSAQSVWGRWTRAERAKPLEDVEIGLTLYGNTT